MAFLKDEQAAVFKTAAQDFHNMELREYIAKRRKELGISQSEMASAMGYTDTAVSKIESGASTPPMSILPSLANILKIDLNDLLTMKEHPSPFTSLNPPYDWKTVSLNLRALRLSCHLRQKEAALQIGVNKRTLVTYEKGDACPNFSVLMKILSFYPGKPVDFFYGVLYPEIQNSPSFRKRGPSPFFVFLIAFLVGGGLAVGVMAPFLGRSASSSNSAPYQLSSTSGDTSALTSISTSIPYLKELVVIGPDGVAFDAAMKPNSTLRIGVYTGVDYSEQMRKRTLFSFALESTDGKDITLEADPNLYPCQIVKTGNVDIGTLFTVTLKASLLSDPSVVVEGVPLNIVVNDTGLLTD